MSLAKNSAFTILTQIAIQFLGILSGIIMARSLGPEGRGIYALYFTNAQLLFTFSSISINTALIYFIPSGKFSTEKLLGFSFLINFLSSIVCLVFIFISFYSSLQPIFFSEGYLSSIFIAWLILYSIALLFGSTYTGFFQATRNFPLLNKTNLIVSIFSFLGFTLLFLTRQHYNWGVQYYLMILFVTQLFSIALFAWAMKSKLKIKPSFHFNIKTDFKGLKRFLLATHASIVINFFNYKFSTWAINYYISEVALGWYSLAVNLGGLFSLITEPLALVLTPYLTQKTEQEKKKMFYIYFRLFLLVMAFAAFISVFVAPFVIPWIYGQDFLPSVILFQLAVPGIVFAALTRIVSSFNFASGRQDINLISTIIGFAFMISANLWLIPIFFEKGAVIANSISSLIIFLSILLMSSNKLKVSIKMLFFVSLQDIAFLKNGLKKLFK